MEWIEEGADRPFRMALGVAAVLHVLVLLFGQGPRATTSYLEPEVVIPFRVAQMPRLKPRLPEVVQLPVIDTRPVRVVPVPEVEPIVERTPTPLVELPIPPVAMTAPIRVPPDLAPPNPPADLDGPIEVGGRVVAPLKLYAPPPTMPSLALRARRFGDVVLQATIDRNGELVGLEVVSGPGLGLEDAALRAVRTWRFSPATLDDAPVAVRWRLVVSFREQR